MNIWFINHYAVPPEYYPLARQKYFSKYLKKKGHNVIIFCASTVHNSDKNLIVGNEKYKVMHEKYADYVVIKCSNYQGNGLKRIVNMVQFARRLPNICKKFKKPDVIVSVSLSLQACRQGLRIAKKFGCQGIAEIADLWPESLISYGYLREKSFITKYLRHYEKSIYLKADRIVFTMEGAYDYIKERGWVKDIPESKVFFINNGVDLEDFDYFSKQKINSNYLFTQSNKKNFIYCGAIREANNVIEILDAAKKFSSSANFIIYGNGNQFEDIKNRILKEKISNVFLMGSISKSEIPAVLVRAYATLFIVSDSSITRFGISPNKMFDYFASGKPMVMNIDCKYNPASNYHACLCPKKGENLYDVILRAINLSDSEYLSYCKNALYASKQYSFEKLTNDYLSLFKVK